MEQLKKLRDWKEYLKRFTENRNNIKILAVIMIIITAFLLYGMKGNDDTITIEDGNTADSVEVTEETDASGSNASSDSNVLYVDVDGAVINPGVYEMKPGDRVFNAIAMAGGLTKSADTSAINQAEEVTDGQKIHIPEKGGDTSSLSGSGTSDSSSGTGATSPGGKININTAGAEELQEITGVGPATAEKIIDYRTQNGRFQSTEDIKNVSGIGDKTYEKMKDSITV